MRVARYGVSGANASIMALIRELRTWGGERMGIDVETVGEIARTANGKFKFVVSDLARSKLGM